MKSSVQSAPANRRNVVMFYEKPSGRFNVSFEKSSSSYPNSDNFSTRKLRLRMIFPRKIFKKTIDLAKK